MKSTIDKNGQTTILEEICQQFNLSAGDQLKWIIENGKIWTIPVNEDLIEAFRGSGKGGSTARLLIDRASDKSESEY